MEKQVMVTG